jgi:hypothetical protein
LKSLGKLNEFEIQRRSFLNLISSCDNDDHILLILKNPLKEFISGCPPSPEEGTYYCAACTKESYSVGRFEIHSIAIKEIVEEIE